MRRDKEKGAEGWERTGGGCGYGREGGWVGRWWTSTCTSNAYSAWLACAAKHTLPRGWLLLPSDYRRSILYRRLILDYFQRSECAVRAFSLSLPPFSPSLFRSLWQKMGNRADRCTVFCWISLRASVVQWAHTTRKKLDEACAVPARTRLFPSVIIWLKIREQRRQATCEGKKKNVTSSARLRSSGVDRDDSFTCTPSICPIFGFSIYVFRFIRESRNCAFTLDICLIVWNIKEYILYIFFLK